MLTILKISYAKYGALEETFQRLLYNSGTDSLALFKVSASSSARTLEGKVGGKSKQIQSQSQIVKKISHADREKLVQIVVRSGFFETDIFYPPDSRESKDYALMSLAVKLDDKLHTVVWTDVSRDAPAYLNLVIEALQVLAK